MTQRERRGRDPGRLFTVFYRLFTLFLTAHAENDLGIGLIIHFDSSLRLS
jgi:hypothetical protein